MFPRFPGALLLFCIALRAWAVGTGTDSIRSPNGQVHLQLWLDATGVPTYSVAYGAEHIVLVAPSRLGSNGSGNGSLRLPRALPLRAATGYAQRDEPSTIVRLPAPYH